MEMLIGALAIVVAVAILTVAHKSQRQGHGVAKRCVPAKDDVLLL